MARSIRIALVDSIRSGFAKYEEQRCIATVQFIEQLAAESAQPDFSHCFTLLTVSWQA